MTVINKEIQLKLDHWIAKFPTDQKQSAVLPALMIVQENNGGWLTDELMHAVADYLDMPIIAVYEVAKFYSMYDLKPVGKYKIALCTNISCLLAGSDVILEYLEKKTQDNPDITLKKVECLGACINAPVMHIGHQYYENVTPDKIDKILDGLS